MRIVIALYYVRTLGHRHNAGILAEWATLHSHVAYSSHLCLYRPYQIAKSYVSWIVHLLIVTWQARNKKNNNLIFIIYIHSY